MLYAKSLMQMLLFLQDPRVDVCVYFIAPHRLKQMDVEFMKRLSLVSTLLHVAHERPTRFWIPKDPCAALQLDHLGHLGFMLQNGLTCSPCTCSPRGYYFQ